MRISGVVTAALGALLLDVGAMAQAAQAATVAVSAERLLDVATGKYLEKPLVVIVDGRISAVEHQGEAVPAGATRVDLPGVTLLPGLIDMHVHLTSSPLYGGYNYLQFTDSFWPVIATRHAKDTLEAGFTTVRNVGAEGYADVALRDAIEANEVPGPRMLTSGPPPWTITGWTPSILSSTASAANSLATSSSPMAWPPYLMTTVSRS